MSGRVKMKKKTDNPWLICGALAVFLILGSLIVFVANQEKDKDKGGQEDEEKNPSRTFDPMYGNDLMTGMAKMDGGLPSPKFFLIGVFLFVAVTAGLCFCCSKLDECCGESEAPIVTRNPGIDTEVHEEKPAPKTLKLGISGLLVHKKCKKAGFQILVNENEVHDVRGHGCKENRGYLSANMVTSSCVPQWQISKAEFV